MFHTMNERTLLLAIFVKACLCIQDAMQDGGLVPAKNEHGVQQTM